MTRNCGNRAWLAGTGFFIFLGKPSENVTITYLTKHTACAFHKFYIYLFLPVLLDKYAYRRFTIQKLQFEEK